MLVTEPVWLRCFLVEFGRNRVILPYLDDQYLYERLARLGGIKTQFTAEPLNWPEEPLHTLDFP